MEKSLSLGLYDLRDFRSLKLVSGYKYHLEYGIDMFKLKPIPPPKPDRIAIIKVNRRKIGSTYVVEYNHLLNTNKVTFDKTKKKYFISPGSFYVKHNIYSKATSLFSFENNFDRVHYLNITMKFKPVIKDFEVKKFEYSTLTLRNTFLPASVSNFQQIDTLSEIEEEFFWFGRRIKKYSIEFTTLLTLRPYDSPMEVIVDQPIFSDSNFHYS